MPRPTDLPPQYLIRTVNGREYAYTRLNGRQISLGPARSEKARKKFAWATAAFDQQTVGGGKESTYEDSETTTMVVAELADAFVRHEADRVRQGRVHKNALWLAKTAAEALLEEHGSLLVSEFKGKALKAIQTRLLATPCQTNAGRHCRQPSPPTLSRKEVNARINKIRQIFRWGVSEDSVPSDVLVALDAVQGARRGDGRETEERTPVPLDLVQPVLSHLDATPRTQPYSDVLRFMLYTGCRPGEAVKAKISDVVDSDPPRILLQEHKTSKATGKARLIPLAPQALEVVRTAIGRRENPAPDDCIFQRQTLREDFVDMTSNGLYQVVRKACETVGCKPWSPYQLRHTAATLVLEATESEAAAAALLGHTPDSRVIKKYTRERGRIAANAARSLETALQGSSLNQYLIGCSLEG